MNKEEKRKAKDAAFAEYENAVLASAAAVARAWDKYRATIAALEAEEGET